MLTTPICTLLPLGINNTAQIPPFHTCISSCDIHLSQTMEAIVALAFAFLVLPFSSPAEALSSNYYDHTCPQLESIVRSAVQKAVSSDKTVPAALLRMHFHDCFIRV